MSLKETREKESNVLAQELKDKQKHLFTLRSQAVTEKLEDPSQLRKARREIAQLRTILRERELADEKNKKAAAATAK
jgi:large subunit ribosomal protein L29